jgi:hypothetical protein
MQRFPEKLHCESHQECEEWFDLFRMVCPLFPYKLMFTQFCLYFKFDADNDGFIPALELKSAVRTGAYAFGLTREEAGILISGVDRNKDNFVDFPEFSALVPLIHLTNLWWFSPRWLVQSECVCAASWSMPPDPYFPEINKRRKFDTCSSTTAFRHQFSWFLFEHFIRLFLKFADPHFTPPSGLLLFP